MPENSFQVLFDRQAEKSHELREEPIENRIKRIKSIEKWTIDHQKDIREAVFKDLGKPASPTDISEIFIVTSEARKAYKNLKRWARPQKIDAPLTQLGTRSTVNVEPKGTCLLISPWNFPYNLTIIPLISCLAAGNTAILKPSELSVHTSSLVAKMCKELFDPEIVAVIQGDKDVAEELLKLPFDHIFFTGSPAIGKIIMRAAANHLSGLTLELGGKNPAFIAPDADLKDAAKKLTWGNFLNCGQSCVAVDYILVPEERLEELKSGLEKWITKYYTGDAVESTYGKIIDTRHWDRLNTILEESEKEGLEIQFFGQPDRSSLYMPPVLIFGANRDSFVMQDEIFGPLLPIITYSTLEEAISFSKTFPKPLAEYVFTRSASIRKKFEKTTTSGALVINDLVIQFAHKNLPFGGVNNSGMGKAHGYWGFREFSNEKPIIRQLRKFTMIQLLYPPYTNWKKRLISFLIRFLG